MKQRGYKRINDIEPIGTDGGGSVVYEVLKRHDQAAVVTAVQVVDPLVLTYIRSLVVEPSVRRYNDPFAADSVGAPEPKNTPRFAVVPNFNPLPIVPPAGVAVVGRMVTPVSGTTAVITASAELSQVLVINVPETKVVIY